MRTTGIVRKTDELGRITIPRELRKILGIEHKTPLEIFVEGEEIILKKYEVWKACAVTGKASPSNKVYKGNVILSPEGRDELLSQLQSDKLLSKN
ncbi:AbrB/MazE/SpoVT family DNA-binding domain-containing protein (plasmid) [Bacillus megaterium]|nr:AbrB/MazE/SpoVT family DNA-binding domain-containing protein [Priestia megaterium]